MRKVNEGPSAYVVISQPAEGRWSATPEGTLPKRRFASLKRAIASCDAKFMATFPGLRVEWGLHLELDDLLTIIEMNPWPASLQEDFEDEVRGGPEYIDLSGCDLDDIDLSPQALKSRVDAYESAIGGMAPWWCPSGFYFAHAILRRTQFRNANLESAILTGADLSGTLFFNANLAKADLSETTVEDTYFDRCN
jgi:Pentapeptide repeats (8 copies)